MTSDEYNTTESLIRNERWDDVVRYWETSEGREEVIRLHNSNDTNYRPLHEVLKLNRCPPLAVIEAILKIFPNEPAEINQDGVTALQYAIAFDEVKGFSAGILTYSLNVLRRGPSHLPISHIQAMLRSCPQSASMTYQDGQGHLQWTIHLAMSYDISQCGDLIQALLDADPTIARPKHYYVDGSRSTTTAADGALTYLPLRAACQNGHEVAIQILLKAYPEAAAYGQQAAWSLLHELSLRNLEPVVINRLIEANPAALESPAADNQLPLHIACREYQGDTIKVLLEAKPSTARVPDLNGNLPLHMALLQKPYARRFARLYGDTMERLLDSYPESVLHGNHYGQLPLHTLHLVVNEETWDMSKAHITYVSTEEEQAANDNSSDEQTVPELFQKHSWLHLLVATYRQLRKSYDLSCSIGHGCDTNDEDEPNMWHVVASIGHLMEATKLDNILLKLTNKMAIGAHYDSQALDSNGNTMLHHSCFSLFLASKVMTHPHPTKSSPEHLATAVNNNCENDDDDDLAKWGQKSHLAVLLKYIELPLACQMARRHNRDGNLPLHVLLTQPCGTTLPCCPNPNDNKKNSRKCSKFFDMTRLIDLFPASILERQESCNSSKITPYMIAASSCAQCCSNKSDQEEQCLQCLSCIYLLLRFGGMEQFH